MRIKPYSLAAVVALCCIAQAGAADVGAQSGSGSGADPVDKSDHPAPHPLSADQVAPAAPAADPAPGAVGNAPNADPNPPASSAEAKNTAKAAAKPAAKPAAKAAKAAEPKGPKADDSRRVVVWVQPGHETFGIGKILSFEADEAERLRGAGRVRYASEAEIKAAGDEIPEV